MIENRKGQFSVPNLLGVVLIVFILGVMWTPMMQGIQTSWNGAKLLTKAALVTIPLGLFISIFAYILTSSERPVRRVENVPGAVPQRGQAGPRIEKGAQRRGGQQ